MTLKDALMNLNMKYLTKLFKKQGGASPNTKTMTIETKFKINDLVQHKFAKSPTLKGMNDLKTSIKFFEVLYIHTETCSAGTQVFYRCRPYYPIVENAYKADSEIIDIGFGIGQNGTEGTSYFREDELKPMSNEDKTFYGVVAGG